MLNVPLYTKQAIWGMLFPANLLPSTENEIPGEAKYKT